MPGGLVEVGETLEAAAIREIREETSLHIQRPKFMRYIEIIQNDAQGHTQFHYVLGVFVAHAPAGTAIAGDDAADVGWFTLEEISDLNCTARTLELTSESRRVLFGNDEQANVDLSN